METRQLPVQPLQQKIEDNSNIYITWSGELSSTHTHYERQYLLRIYTNHASLLNISPSLYQRKQNGGSIYKIQQALHARPLVLKIHNTH